MVKIILLVSFVLLSLIRREGWGGLIWLVTMYMGENNLNVTCPVGECFQKLVSNPVFIGSFLVQTDRTHKLTSSHLSIAQLV